MVFSRRRRRKGEGMVAREEGEKGYVPAESEAERGGSRPVRRREGLMERFPRGGNLVMWTAFWASAVPRGGSLLRQGLIVLKAGKEGFRCQVVQSVGRDNRISHSE